jgi:hypothetical protein
MNQAEKEIRQPTEKPLTWRFDPVDITQMRLLAQLPPGWRICPMLEAQALVRGIILGRLHRQYPDASERELGLKLLEELSRARSAPNF